MVVCVTTDLIKPLRLAVTSLTRVRGTIVPGGAVSDEDSLLLTSKASVTLLEAYRDFVCLSGSRNLNFEDTADVS